MSASHQIHPSKGWACRLGRQRLPQPTFETTARRDMWPYMRILWRNGWASRRPTGGGGLCERAVSGRARGIRGHHRLQLRARLLLASAVCAGSAMTAGSAHAQRRPRIIRGGATEDRRISMEEALHNMEERSGRLFEMLDLDGSGYLDVVELQVRQSPILHLTHPFAACRAAAGVWPPSTNAQPQEACTPAAHLWRREQTGGALP